MRGHIEIMSTAHEDVLSLPKYISANVADWEVVSFIDEDGNKVTIKNGADSDGKPLREIHATLTKGQDLTRGFPSDFEHYTVSVAGSAKLIEDDLDRLWTCNPIKMSIIVFDRDDKVADECTYSVAKNLQNRLVQNNITWTRLQHLALTLFKNSIHLVEPKIFIDKLYRPNDDTSLQSLIFDCETDISLIEIGFIKDDYIPGTWCLANGSDPLNILYTPQPAK